VEGSQLDLGRPSPHDFQIFSLKIVKMSPYILFSRATKRESTGTF
jgi:hypothetical protein